MSLEDGKGCPTLLKLKIANIYSSGSPCSENAGVTYTWEVKYNYSGF